jgi:hypothetical protein
VRGAAALRRLAVARGFAVGFGGVAFRVAGLGLGLAAEVRFGLTGAAGDSGVADPAAADAALVVAVVFGAAAGRAGVAGPVVMRAGRCAERLPITPGASRLGFAVFFLGFSAIVFESTISPHVRRRHRRLTTK